ncbi:hypothetical protein GCM10007301_04800 [Azorhizobium oxalatiphilum]|uniref:Uncharacterized protein n=1 Tax=Azorhizobium oxalatiphilum TaxID=980631 RepID=A0A917BLT7_9HYPH|nr:SMI1/KNR4 family protein [Azorhizobium oxalatiphilum]GGF48557.1 hypothetical protein GCM10007301_04800 [Azorhizobium oxalatiphilum]
MQIETVAASLPLEKDPATPFQYAEADLVQLEERIGARLPDDMRWYLAHVGWRKLKSGHRTLLIRQGDYLYAPEFEAAEHETFSLRHYDAFRASPESALLPGERALYFPFGEAKGGSPQARFRLVVSLNAEDAGAIWAVRAIGHFEDQTPPQPLRLADDLSGFLTQIGPEKKLGPVAQKNNEQLFDRLLADYLAAPAVAPTTAGEPDTLLRAFFDQPDAFLFDGARNAEYQVRVNGARIVDAATFAAEAANFATTLAKNPYWAPGPLRRSDVRIAEPEPFEDAAALGRRKHGYHLVKVESRVGDGHKLVETYLLHRDKDGWTLVRRHDASIADVKIRDVGTATFSGHHWELKKKVTPAWSERAFSIEVDGREDALTLARIALLKDIIGNTGFRAAFEAYVFRLYTERLYPDFEAMEGEEKKEWADHFPPIAAPSEIWRLIGKRCALYVRGDSLFHIATDACFDPEHGLTLDVEDWAIRP